MKPTNVTLLDPNKVTWALMRPVSSVDVKEGLSNNLHPDGLYSVETFGRVGSKERDSTKAYIDVKLPIFNPTYFNNLVGLKSIYAGIIKGTEYAVWDDNEKNFIKSNILEGETGFSFFMKHFGDIKYVENDSYKHNQKINLIQTYKPQALSSKILVIPAGLRDVQFEPDGRTVEMEINELYRKVIFRSRSVVVEKGQEESPVYDNVRWGIQSGFLDIDDYIAGIMRGKGGFWQRRVGTRGVVGGTRNVITARQLSSENADDDNGADVNSTDIGMYQALLAFQYIARYALLTGTLSKVFTVGSNMAKLVNPQTFQYEYREIDGNIVDKWMSSDGLTKLFNGFKNTHLRHKPIKIDGCYMALVYDDGKNVKIVGDADELPEGFDRKHLHPMTYMELFYLNCVKEMERRLLQITRYPITGRGSIYPSTFKIKTTMNAGKRTMLDEFWEPDGRCYYYPTPEDEPTYFDAMSVDGSKLSLLGGDHDGDQLNCNSICTEDAIQEALTLMKTREYYITGSGKFLYDPIVEPHLFLFRALSNALRK